MYYFQHSCNFSKYTIRCFSLLLLFLFLQEHGYAQCTDPECLTDNISLNTGVDAATGNTLPASTPTTTVQDGQWILINAPTSNGPVNLGAPAFVISTNPSWDEMQPVLTPPSKYISAFPLSTNNEANINGTPYTFQKKICVCSPTIVSVSDNIHVDNRVKLTLKGPGLGAGIVLSDYNSTVVANFRNPPENDGTVSNISLAIGTYYIEAEMQNDNSGSPMGLNIQGSLIANSMSISNPSCCNNGAFISGFKFLDKNCDGIHDSNELFDSGWPIELYDATGTTLINTTTTDVNGYYFFNIITSGTYIIKETAPPSGWNQTFPSTPNTHSVTITGTEIISNLNFGNCCIDCYNFLLSPGSVTVNCSNVDDAVTFTPSGLLPTDFYSVDINGNGVNEIANIPGNQNTTHIFPHYGTFSLTITLNRPFCEKPCELEITKDILIEPSACEESYCYEWEEVTPLCNVTDMTFWNGQPTFCGDLVFGIEGIITWNGTGWDPVGNWNLFFSSHLVREIEPYEGNLYALTIFNNQQGIYRYNGSNWSLSYSIPLNSNYYGGLRWRWSHEEMFHSEHGLYVAVHQNIGSRSSHIIYEYDGTSWTNIPTTSLSSILPGTIEQYYQVGQHNGYPVIRIEFTAGGSLESHLAAWNGTQWILLTSSPFVHIMTAGTSIENLGMGIQTIFVDGNTIYAGGNFKSINGLPNTQMIIKYDMANNIWSEVGGGVSSALSPANGSGWGILDVKVIGTDIFINGSGIEEMGGTPVNNTAWYNGTKWQDLAPSTRSAIYMTSYIHKNMDGECEVHFAGECIYGKTKFCCTYEDITLNNIETGKKTYQTHGTITSSSTIAAPDGNITYKAGNGVNLTSSFNVQPGAVFQANNMGCTDCCPDDPLNDLPFLAPFVGNPNISISQCMYNGDCIYVIADYCIRSDGVTSYYDCLGTLICESFQVGGSCPPNFNVQNCVILQSCPPNIVASPSDDVIQFSQDEKETAQLIGQMHAFPNPFKDELNVNFELLEDSSVSLAIYNLNGNKMADLLHREQKNKGMHTLQFVTADLKEGVYIITLITADNVVTKSVVLMR